MALTLADTALATSKRRSSVVATVDERPQVGCLRKAQKKFLSLLALFAFILCAALCFKEAELQREKDEALVSRQESSKALNELLECGCVSNETLALIERATAPSRCGTDGDNMCNWNIIGSAYFTFTIFTTIGYGNFTPVTSWGWALVWLWGAPGIGLTGAFAYALGDDVSNFMEWLIDTLYAGIRRWFRSRVTPAKPVSKPKFPVPPTLGQTKAMGWKTTSNIKGAMSALRKRAGRTSRYTIWRHIVTSVAVQLGYWVILALLWSSSSNDWDVIEGLYFIFVSHTTIGLGDYTPVDSGLDSGFWHVWKFVLWVISTLVGLGLMADLLASCRQAIDQFAQRMNDELLDAIEDIADAIDDVAKGVRNKVNRGADAFDDVAKGVRNKVNRGAVAMKGVLEGEEGHIKPSPSGSSTKNESLAGELGITEVKTFIPPTALPPVAVCVT